MEEKVIRKVVTGNVPIEVVEYLKKKAKESDRTLTAQVTRIINEWYREQIKENK